MSGDKLLLIGRDHASIEALRAAGFVVEARDTIPANLSGEEWAAVIVDARDMASSHTGNEISPISSTVPCFVLSERPLDTVPEALGQGVFDWIYSPEIASGVAARKVSLARRLCTRQHNLEEELRTKTALEKELALRIRAVDHARKLNADLVGSIPAGLVILDISGIIILINEPARGFLGLKSAELTGLHYRSSLPHSARQIIDDSVEAAHTKAMAPTLKRVRLNEKYLQVSSCRVLDYTGQPVGILLFFQDITDQETAALQLYRAEKLAALGTMLSGIAHELRNPLSIISARAQRARARTDPDDEWMRRNMQSVEEQTERCGAIINGLLDFARQRDMTPGNHQISEIIDEVMIYASYQTSLDRIQLDRSGVGDSSVFGDRSRLVQAFLNIILNAADSMNGTGALKVSTDVEPEWVTVRINDTGPGIDPSIAREVFNPFFTTKDPGKGTGLGLSITQKIVQESDGEIWFESHPGNTSFFVKLPSTRGRRHA